MFIVTVSVIHSSLHRLRHVKIRHHLWQAEARTTILEEEDPCLAVVVQVGLVVGDNRLEAVEHSRVVKVRSKLSLPRLLMFLIQS